MSVAQRGSAVSSLDSRFTACTTIRTVCCIAEGIAKGIAEGPLPAGDPVPFALTPKVTNERSLEAAVKYASEFLNKAVKPVLVGGVKMRWPGKAQDAFLELSEAGELVGTSSLSSAEVCGLSRLKPTSFW